MIKIHAFLLQVNYTLLKKILQRWSEVQIYEVFKLEGNLEITYFNSLILWKKALGVEAICQAGS